MVLQLYMTILNIFTHVVTGRLIVGNTLLNYRDGISSLISGMRTKNIIHCVVE